MKRKRLVVLAFFTLLLFIAPAAATEYGTSEYSVTSFAETLPDDVMFYPDTFYNDTIVLAEAGDAEGPSVSGTYLKTFEQDADAYYARDISSPYDDCYIYLNFSVAGQFAIDGFAYATYVSSYNFGEFVQFYNFTGSAWVTFDSYGGGGYSWENGTTYDPSFWNDENTVMMRTTGLIDNPAPGKGTFVDYAELTFYVMTLADSVDHFAESFADVSDWEKDANLESFSSDGDILSMEMDAESENDYEYIQTTGLSISTDGYVEMRVKANDTCADYIQFRLYNEGSTKFYYTQFSEPTSWATYKYHIKSDLTNSGGDFDTIETIRLYIRLDAPNSIKVQYDYLRIASSDEMGFQHDGSTTAGVTNDAESGFSYSTSSDGDILSCNVSRTSGSGSTFVEVRVLFDTTATAADLERDYYQFFAARLKLSRSSSASSTVYASLMSDGYLSTITTSVSALSDWTTLRANHKASSSSNPNEFFRFGAYLDATDDWVNLQFDWVKAGYSIANWTYSVEGAEGGGATVTTNVTLHATSGVLYSSAITGTGTPQIILDHDPALAVECPPYDLWNIITNSGTPQTDYYIDSAWIGYSAETSGALETGSLTDVRIKFTAAASIAAIIFLDIPPEWHIIDTVRVYFDLTLDPEAWWAFNAWLIIAGLVMIPVSALYLVKGGREELSNDKLFFALVIFFVGWSLFLGGIMP